VAVPRAGHPEEMDRDLARAGLPPLPRTAWLEIDLDALARNLGVIRELAGPGVPVHPVVKANAYGHGAGPVAHALATAGADGFCVATYDEAVELRGEGIRSPILVLFPVPAAWAREAARRGIEITAGDRDLLAATLVEVAAGTLRRPLGIQLEVETGLGRGGFDRDGLVTAAQAIQATTGARLTGMWTHLQASEDRANTASQVRAFEDATAAIRAAGIRLPRRHLRASGALLGGSSPTQDPTAFDGTASYEGVRPGLSIYGLLPDELAGSPLAAPALRLRPVLSLRARAVRVQELPEGWGVSYGPTFRTPRPSRIATLPLGYGDGWARVLSNRADALVRGLRVPLVGNVAMDAVMVDVTDVPGRDVTVEDVFTLIGRQGDEAITVGEVARSGGTNSWEVVTSMARRLPRVYHAASGPVLVRTLVSGGRG
jgi:alanine racemase